MSRSLVHAINAIEEAGPDDNVTALRNYCTDECGLSEEMLQRLIDIPGNTDLGRVTRALDPSIENFAQTAPPEAVDEDESDVENESADTDKGEGADGDESAAANRTAESTESVTDDVPSA